MALLISQFTQERGPAAGWTAGLLLVFIVLDMVHRVVPSSEWISRLSPVYYYNLSKPLVPSYGANAGAMLALLALAALREFGFELPASIPESLVVIALGSLATIFVLIRVISIPDSIVAAGRGIGIWISLLAAIAVIVAGLLRASEEL